MLAFCRAGQSQAAKNLTFGQLKHLVSQAKGHRKQLEAGSQVREPDGADKSL